MGASGETYEVQFPYLRLMIQAWQSWANFRSLVASGSGISFAAFSQSLAFLSSSEITSTAGMNCIAEIPPV